MRRQFGESPADVRVDLAPISIYEARRDAGDYVLKCSAPQQRQRPNPELQSEIDENPDQKQ
jgi:hypothetical protein